MGNIKNRKSPFKCYYWNISQCNISHKVKLGEWGSNPLPYGYEVDMLTIWLKAWTASQVASSLPILIEILHSSLYVWKTCVITVLINISWDSQATPLWHHWNISHCNISHHVNLEWDVNLLPSDYEVDMLTIWLKTQTANQVASRLPILTWILYYGKKEYDHTWWPSDMTDMVMDYSIVLSWYLTMFLLSAL